MKAHNYSQSMKLYFSKWGDPTHLLIKVTKGISMNMQAERVTSQISHVNLANHIHQNWTMEINEHNFLLYFLIPVGILMPAFILFSHCHPLVSEK